MDWVKRTSATATQRSHGANLMRAAAENEGTALAGLKPGERPGAVTPAELARHSTAGDLWMALRGRVCVDVCRALQLHRGLTAV